MSTTTSIITGQKILTVIVGTATATTGDAALLGIQNPGVPVIHFEVDSGNTITSINWFLSTDNSGTLTNYKKIITTS